MSKDTDKVKKKLIIVDGTIGVGKTTVCKILYKSIQRCVWLDGDWCWMMNPWMVSEENKRMVEDNTTHLLRNFLVNSSFDYVIFCRVMHRKEIFDAILNPLRYLEFELIRITLTCSEEALKLRIRNDSSNEDILQRAFQRLRVYDYTDAIKIDTTSLTPEEVATKILRIVGYQPELPEASS